MTEKTPGQASWIARNAALGGAQDDADMLLTWPYLDPEQQEAEEAGAKAAITAGAPAELAAAMAETRKMRAAVTALAAEMDDDAAKDETAILVVDSATSRLLLQRRAELSRAHATRLRAAIGGRA